MKIEIYEFTEDARSLALGRSFRKGERVNSTVIPVEWAQLLLDSGALVKVKQARGARVKSDQGA